MTFPLATSTVVAAFMFFLGLLVYHKGRHKRLNTAFLLMLLSTIGWLITAALADAARTEQSALLLWKLAMIGPILFCPIFLYFTALFPDGEAKNNANIL